VLINLEDLWLETRPQNVPGTQRKQNWSQKAHCTFEQFSNSPVILEILKEINRKRKKSTEFFLYTGLKLQTDVKE
jgi:4-alpha-glucanotransferase